MSSKVSQASRSAGGLRPAATVGVLQPAQHSRRKLGLGPDTQRGAFTESSDTSSTYGGNSRYLPLNSQRPGDNVRLANTYKVQPDANFPVDEVRHIVDGVLQSHLHGRVYEPTVCAQLCETLAALIMTMVKDLSIPRFRLLSIVNIAQRSGQGMHVVSRCLWDTRTDVHVSVPYENSTLVCVATLYALYLE